MAYDTPDDFSAGNILTAEQMDRISANTVAIKNPTATDINNLTVTANYTTTSTSFANVDTTANTFELSITPDADGGTTWVRVWARLTLRCNSTSTVKSSNLDISRDGTSLSGGTGMLTARGNSDQLYPVSLEHWDQISGTAAVTYRLRWRVESNGTAQINALTGGVSEMQPSFGAREIS